MSNNFDLNKYKIQYSFFFVSVRIYVKIVSIAIRVIVLRCSSRVGVIRKDFSELSP